MFFLMLALTLLSCKEEGGEIKVAPEEIQYTDANFEVSLLEEKRDSIIKAEGWRKLSCGLWINKNKEVGLATIDGHAILDGEEKYIFIVASDSIALVDIVDTNSFSALGNNYYKDKKNIYHHYTMADGGYFNVRSDIDYDSFMIIHDCYAKDLNSIYYRGGVINNADVQTFKTDTSIDMCLAKDKNHYYLWGDTVTQEEMKDSNVLAAMEILNK